MSNSGLHILIVTPYFPSENNPANGIFIHQQALVLQQRGHQVKVLHIMRSVPPWRMNKVISSRRDTGTSNGITDGVSVQRVKYYWPAHTVFDRWWCSVISLALRGAFRDETNNTLPEIIYSQWLLPTTAACVRLKRIFDVPVVGIARGYDLMELPLRSIALRRELDTVWKKSDRIIANGEWAFDQLRMLGYDPAARGMGLVRNVKDLSLLLALDPPPHDHGPLNIATVAALETHKGIDVLLKACAIIKHNTEFRLIVVGDGSQRLYLEMITNQLGLKEQVSFIGAVSQSGVRKALSESHVFALPSRRDGSPNALVEAMAASLACVASNVGGIPYLLENEISGLLVTPDNSESLAKAISRLAHSESLRQSLGANARQRAQRLYSYQENALALEDVLLSTARAEPHRY